VIPRRLPKSCRLSGRNGIERSANRSLVYTLDTNAIIYFLNRDANVTSLIQAAFDNNAPLYVSTITVTELLAFPSLSSEEATGIESLLQTVFLIPVDIQVARAAGAIRKEYRIKLADSVIAATALSTHTTLLTRNAKDFKRVAGLSLQQI
jgi:toxin FitB